MKLHWKQEMKYLNAVANYLTSLGYKVNEPDSKNRDFLDVWGSLKGRKCFEEIYVTMYKCGNGINGIWHQGNHDGIEVYLDPHPLYGLDTRNDLTIILDGLKPIQKKKRGLK